MLSIVTDYFEVFFTLCGEGKLVVVLLVGYSDLHLHLVEKGGVDLCQSAPHHTRVLIKVCVLVL